MKQEKPGLMLAVMEGLKKRSKTSSSDEDLKKSSLKKEEDVEGDEELEDYRLHLEEISKDFIRAIQDEDSSAVADLFEEAFECLESSEHFEGPHLDEEKPRSSRY